VSVLFSPTNKGNGGYATPNTGGVTVGAWNNDSNCNMQTVSVLD
jgi:hypothetical protein